MRSWLLSIAIVLVAIFQDLALANGLESLESFLKGTSSARASFTQTVTQPPSQAGGAASTRPRTSTGVFEFQRPDRFRFVYQKPFAQTIVADGQTLWYHDAELNQVTARAQAQALGQTPAALFASATDLKSLGQSFDLQAEPDLDGLQWAQAVPRKEAGRDALIQRVRIGLRPVAAGGPPELAVLEIVDSFGQRSVMRFASFERNVTPRPDAFVFKPPAGADVIRQ